jgi:hypothetical protein
VVYEGDDFWASTTNKQLNFVARDKCSLDLLWLKDELEFPFATRYVRAVPGVSPPK